MVSYNSTLCDRWVDEDYGEFLGEPNSSEEAEQPPVTVVASSSVGFTCIILCGKFKEAATGYKSRVHQILLCTDIAHVKKLQVYPNFGF